MAVFEVGGDRKEIWYSTTPEHGHYFCTDRADAFVLPVLLYAMRRNRAIELLAPLSEKLSYGITSSLQRALASIFDNLHEVELKAETIASPINDVSGVATGLSCGIDSFATIASHLDAATPNKLTHLTFYDVGGHNPLHLEARFALNLFQKRLELARRCATDLSLPLVVVKSNLHEVFEGLFSSYVTFALASAALAMQKLFKTFLVSSSARFDEVTFHSKWCGEYDMLSLPLISTETLTFYSSGVSLSRIEKTQLVSTFPHSYKYLNVCLYHDQNCSVCEKCLRTQLTLDVLGVLDLYREVFDLELYRANRNWYVGYLLATMSPKCFLRGIYTGMKVRNQLSKYSEFQATFAWYCHRARNRLLRLRGKGDTIPHF